MNREHGSCHDKEIEEIPSAGEGSPWFLPERPILISSSSTEKPQD